MLSTQFGHQKTNEAKLDSTETGHYVVFNFTSSYEVEVCMLRRGIFQPPHPFVIDTSWNPTR